MRSNSDFRVQTSCCFDFDSDPDFDLDLDYPAQQNKPSLGMTKAGSSGPGSLLGISVFSQCKSNIYAVYVNQYRINGIFNLFK